MIHSTENNSADELKLSAAERLLMDDAGYADRQDRLETLKEQSKQINNPVELAAINLEMAGLHLDLDEKKQAAVKLNGLVEIFIQHAQFEDAARACQYRYLCEEEDSISAIGQAAWLSVTYPVDPNLTVSVLDQIIDETPDESDGAAVAAATAHYIVDLRCDPAEKKHLQLFTGSMLARVAKRHSKIEDDDQFQLWVRTMELDEPEKFLVRLRNVIDVLVQTDWLFDREILQKQLPDNPDHDIDNTGADL